jgi:hypothetical protein
MQINLPESGTIFFISDHCHVIENVSQSKLVFSKLCKPNQLTHPTSGATESLKVG